MNPPAERHPQNVLLTGVPRSGTTLICHLLNKLPNAVALHEPMTPRLLQGKPPEAIVDAIGDFFDGQRRTIREDGVATSKSAGGKVPANHLGDREIGGARERILDGRRIAVTNVSGPDFTLYMKHPSFFTACLPFLAPSMECFASVRNPLSVLLSWRNAGMPVTEGRVPAAERFDAPLRRSLAQQPDVLDRQLIILDFFFRRFAEHLDGRVVRYEDVVATAGRALAPINPDAARLNEALSSRNDRAVRTDPGVADVADRLLSHDNACWNFYSRDDVERLLR